MVLDVAREGKVLYPITNDSGSFAPLARSSRVSERPATQPASVGEWLAAGDQDRRLIGDLWTLHDHWAAICFHAQLAAEKYMKALLVARRVRPKRTHDLSVLLAMLRDAGCALPDPDQDCTMLTEHAVEPRYVAGATTLDEPAARAATDAVERIVRAVRSAHGARPPDLRQSDAGTRP
jgi:HEPN domain-containing protein